MRDFDHFSPEAVAFLSDLRQNNNREWFTAYKSYYEETVKKPAGHFGKVMSRALETLTGTAHDHKLYRIYRDVRFSKDKTPYNAHIHLSFASSGAPAKAPMWFFGLDSERLTLGCGIFQFDKPGLELFRSEMAGPRGATLMALAARLRAKAIRVPDPALKRVPAGFDKDHPHAEALRHKGFSGWKDIADTDFVVRPDLAARTIAEFSELMPIYRFFTR
ncbi:TIGR02453 family protein [Roseobacter sp. YSTF-M11]|uniref:TIGR02453 family protein n=1 Tax=Roseobacter insulae TaxID=2859783 RepID=A0A9X1FWY9_9RHOB|nr:TIGR02453 family protein [Roseobacter insulae]MBW4709091.1 TIGR02453 family protein [Roseobacter insulae]